MVERGESDGEGWKGINLLFRIGLDVSSEHFDEGGLTSTVLAKHDDDLRVGELALLDCELEVAESLCHVRILVAIVAFLVFVTLHVFGYLERQRHLAEAKILRRHKACQEDVDALSHTEG